MRGSRTSLYLLYSLFWTEVFKKLINGNQRKNPLRAKEIICASLTHLNGEPLYNMEINFGTRKTNDFFNFVFFIRQHKLIKGHYFFHITNFLGWPYSTIKPIW